MPGRLREKHEIAVIFTALSSINLIVNYALNRPSAVGAEFLFLLPCAIISARPRKMQWALVPLLGIPIGIDTIPTGIIGAALLTIGEVLVSIPVAFAEWVLMEWRKQSGPKDRFVIARSAYDLASGPVRALTIIALVVAAFKASGIEMATVILIPALFYWKGRCKTAAAMSLAIAGLSAWNTVPLVLASVALLPALIRSAVRPDRQRSILPRPNPLRHPVVWFAAVRCDLHLSASDLIAARKALRRTAPLNSYLDLRLVHIDVEERSFQSSLSAYTASNLSIERLRPFWAMQYGRALSGIAQFDAARSVYRELLSSDTLVTALAARVRVLLAANELAAGNLDDARRSAEEAIPLLTRRSDRIERLGAERIVAEAIFAKGDVDDAKLWVTRSTESIILHTWNRRVFTDETGRLLRLLLSRAGGRYLEWIRLGILADRISPVADAEGEGEHEAGYETLALAMSLSCRWDDLVDLLLNRASAAKSRGDHIAMCQFSARALSALDRTRYSLAAQSARTSWSRRFERGLAVALEAAYGAHDARFQAELIEFARIQTIPTANGEVVGLGRPAPPPVVRVGGVARLARSDSSNRPPPVDLELAAERAAGSGAWWLSFWQIESWMYWALVPGDSTNIQAGRSSVASGSSLLRDLDELRRSLPVILPGEDMAAASWRWAGSPLQNDPLKEAHLATSLGTSLLPPRLVAAARWHMRHFNRPLPLAIAPAASLGYVPWSLLAMVGGVAMATGQPTTSSRAGRLIEFCDWVLAPSVALLCNAKPLPVTDAPLAIVVADTSEAASLELEGARRQATALLPHVAVLGARQWAPVTATIPALEHTLAQQRCPFTVAFMCHAQRGTASEPSAGGLLMATDEGDSVSVLQPSIILAMPEKRLPMPTQILLQACDTAALSDTSAGEWLTVAPAFVACGCREVVATLYPLLDIDDDNDPLIQAALAGDSLWDALREYQRRSLADWTAGNSLPPTQLPINWAAYAPIGLARGTVGKDDIGNSTEHEDELNVSPRCMAILSSAIRMCAEPRTGWLDSSHVLAAYLNASDLGHLMDGGHFGRTPMELIWSFGPYLAGLPPFQDRPSRTFRSAEMNLRVPAVVLTALLQARRQAQVDGIALEPEHVVTALLRQRSGASRLISLLSILTHRHSLLITRAVEHMLAVEIAKSVAEAGSDAGPKAVEPMMRLLESVLHGELR
jgi:hypothetical protein